MSQLDHGTSSVWEKAQESPDFQELRRRYRKFAFPVTIAFFSWYLLYVLLTAFARDFVDNSVFGNVNIAFVLGLLQFATTFLISLWYSRHAEAALDDSNKQEPDDCRCWRHHDSLCHRRWHEGHHVGANH